MKIFGLQTTVNRFFKNIYIHIYVYIQMHIYVYISYNIFYLATSLYIYIYCILILFSPRYHLLTPPLQMISTSPSSIFMSSYFLVSW